jgi:flagellar hook-associated protein 2
VNVTVSSAVDSIASTLQLFVDSYNKLRDKLDTYTAFDAAAGTKGLLFGSSETLRIDSALSNLITGRFVNDGEVRSLGELGVSIDEEGQLTLDRAKLQARFEADPESVTEFFADESLGFTAKADAILESIVGEDSSLLVNRIETLQRQIENYDERISAWNARLDRNRERLMNQFFKLEEVVARIQNNLSAINQIQFIAPIQRTNT